MSTEPLILSFSLQPDSSVSSLSALDTEYVRLEQVIPVEETATLGEVAEILEELYEVNPCITSVASTPSALDATAGTTSNWGEAPVQTDEEPPFSLEEFQQKIADLFKLPGCLTDSEGNWATQVKVILSDPTIEYSLKLSNGIATKTVLVEETYTEDLNIEAAEGILLAYPIVEALVTDEEVVNIEDPNYFGKITFQWNGSVISESGGIKPPPITRIGNTLYWGEKVSGSLTVTYPTKYWLVNITVYGTEISTLGECSVICFYKQMVETLDLQKPDIEDAKQDELCNIIDAPLLKQGDVFILSSNNRPRFYITRTEWRCQCSGDTSHYTTSPGPTDEQKKSGDFIFPVIYKDVFGGYVDCGETTQDIGTEEFYIENCCYPPEVPLPKCADIYRKNNGGQRLDSEVHDNLLEEYGEQLRIVYLMPDDGDCGTIRYEQRLNSLSCCDEVVEDLAWDEDNSIDIIPSDSQGNITVTGGLLPITWTVRSANVFLNSARTIQKLVTYSRSVTLYSNPTCCGTISVKSDDGCNPITREIRAEDGSWDLVDSWTESDPPEEQLCFSSGTVYNADLVSSYVAVIHDGGYKFTETVDNTYYGDRIIGFCIDSNNVCCLTIKVATSNCGMQARIDCPGAAGNVPANDTCFSWSGSAMWAIDPEDMDLDALYFGGVVASHHVPGTQYGRQSTLSHICGGGECGAQESCAQGHWKQYVTSSMKKEKWIC